MVANSFTKRKIKNKLIFDLDGTMVNTQIPFNSFVESELLRIYQNIIIAPEELAIKWRGMATRKVFKETAPLCDIEFMFQKKWEMMYSLVSEKELRCLPEMYELIVDLHQNKNPLRIASASPRLWVKSCLMNALPYNDQVDANQYKLIDIFKGKYFSAENCTNNKPAPDIFLMADKSFKTKKGTGDSDSKTYVVGDGEGDVKGGIAANFHVLYLSDTDIKYDNNPLVTRFNSSKELASHIRNNLM